MAEGRGQAQSPRPGKTWPRGGHPAPAPKSAALAVVTYATTSASLNPTERLLSLTEVLFAASCKTPLLRCA